MGLQWTLMEYILTGEIVIICVLFLPIKLPKIPDLAPSDFWLFPQLKKYLKRKHYASQDTVQATTKKWLCQQPAVFYLNCLQTLVHRWRVCIQRKGDYVEKLQQLFESESLQEIFFKGMIFSVYLVLFLLIWERNIYYTGFSIFLGFVIHRLATLINSEATLLKRVQNATETAQELIRDKEKRVMCKSKELRNTESKLRNDVVALNYKTQTLSSMLNGFQYEVGCTRNAVEYMKQQTENLNEEYGRLLRELVNLDCWKERIDSRIAICTETARVEREITRKAMNRIFRTMQSEFCKSEPNVELLKGMLVELVEKEKSLERFNKVIEDGIENLEELKEDVSISQVYREKTLNWSTRISSLQHKNIRLRRPFL